MKKIISHQLFMGKFNYLSLLITIIIISICSCTSKTEPYRILKFYGDASISNYSRDLYFISYRSDRVHNGAILIKNGDLLAINDIPVPVSEQLKDSILIKTSPENCYFNNRLVSLNIGEKDTAINILKAILKTDLTDLSIITFESPVPDSALVLLKDIAKIKPRVSVNLGEGFTGLDSVLKILNPEVILINGATQENLDIISRLSKPELILVDVTDSLPNLMIPAMPTLKRLIVSMEGNPIPIKFFSNNPQIESLSIVASGYFDFSEIRDLKMLRDFTLANVDSITNQEILNSLTSVESFSIYPDNFKVKTPLNNLKNLRWISFSPGVSQPDFERIILNNPGVEVVEILDNKELSVTEALLPLKKLYGLILSENPRDSSSINRLQNLRYLSIPKKNLEDKRSLLTLQNSMPNTVIAANEGICLGSGWLLLLFPAIIILRIFLRSKSALRY